MDKGGKQVKDSIHDSREVIQTNSNVLWTYKFTNNVLDYNEWNTSEFNQYWRSSEFY